MMTARLELHVSVLPNIRHVNLPKLISSLHPNSTRLILYVAPRRTD